ncbi:MAG TPA: hypothetical protein VEL28_12680 [Candidatus Binatia bacterium]|nr:hypothetical protein [Candidatus Binatia bacterium]
MSDEILRADPALRRQTLLRLLVMTVAGAIVIGWLLPWFMASVQEARQAGTVRARVVC